MSELDYLPIINNLRTNSKKVYYNLALVTQTFIDAAIREITTSSAISQKYLDNNDEFEKFNLFNLADILLCANINKTNEFFNAFKKTCGDSVFFYKKTKILPNNRSKTFIINYRFQSLCEPVLNPDKFIESEITLYKNPIDIETFKLKRILPPLIESQCSREYFDETTFDIDFKIYIRDFIDLVLIDSISSLENEFFDNVGKLINSKFLVKYNSNFLKSIDDTNSGGFYELIFRLTYYQLNEIVFNNKKNNLNQILIDTVKKDVERSFVKNKINRDIISRLEKILNKKIYEILTNRIVMIVNKIELLKYEKYGNYLEKFYSLFNTQITIPDYIKNKGFKVTEDGNLKEKTFRNYNNDYEIGSKWLELYEHFLNKMIKFFSNYLVSVIYFSILKNIYYSYSSKSVLLDNHVEYDFFYKQNFLKFCLIKDNDENDLFHKHLFISDNFSELKSTDITEDIKKEISFIPYYRFMVRLYTIFDAIYEKQMSTNYLYHSLQNRKVSWADSKVAVNNIRKYETKRMFYENNLKEFIDGYMYSDINVITIKSITDGGLATDLVAKYKELFENPRSLVNDFKNINNSTTNTEDFDVDLNFILRLSDYSGSLEHFDEVEGEIAKNIKLIIKNRKYVSEEIYLNAIYVNDLLYRGNAQYVTS